MSFVDDYKDALSQGATDIYLFPRFNNEKPAYVTYHKGELHSSSMEPSDLKKSRVPKKLFKSIKTGVLSFQDQTWVTIEGVEVSYLRPDNKWFIAKGITAGKKRVPQKWVVLQLHILATQGFLTVQPLGSWATISGVLKDGTAKTQDLPRSKASLKAFYEERVGTLNEVLEGKLRWYWAGMKYQAGSMKRILPVEKIIGLTLGLAVYPGGPK